MVGGQSEQVQESQAIIIVRVPLFCDDFCSKILYRLNFVCVECCIRVPDTGTVVTEWKNKWFVKFGES